MKRAALILLLVVCLMATGCGWMDGNYISVTPHREPDTVNDQLTVSVTNYLELRSALEDMIQSGTENSIINISEYNQSLINSSITTAVRYIRNNYPLGAYAVEDITYEIGTNAGKPAIAVEITYLHSRIEIQRIQTVTDMDDAVDAITQALDNCDAGIVLLVGRYEETDFAQFVSDYAEKNPHTVMEIPQVTAAVYPETGTDRVIEITFAYQNSRENLRLMQNQVEPVFNSAALYVSGDGEDSQKYAQLYSFLMERFDYEIATSITPAYSLLRHGVGDHRAFATVYAAMCRRAGLECQVVTGTRDGEPWNWNIILDDGYYFHVDLLRSSQQGGFRECSDEDMSGYVWDYSAYPACPPLPPPAEETQPSAGETQPNTEETTAPTEDPLPESDPQP